MSAGKMIMVTGSGAQQEFTQDQPNLQFDFEKAHVLKGQWICYQQENYNDASSGEILVVDETDGLQSLGFIPRSIRVVKTFTTGVTLYKHINYGGSQQDVTSSKPSIDLQVSSALMSVGTWHLFQQKDYQGPYVSKGPGRYPRAADLGIPNDSLQSMERQDS